MNKALLIIDMWDKHWCKLAQVQADYLAPRINSYKKDFDLVIHAPSGVKMTTRYRENPHWLKIEVDVKFKNKIGRVEKVDLPIYTGRNSCPDSAYNGLQPFRGIHEEIKILDGEYISNEAEKIFTKLQQVDIVYVCGLHLNMCILKNTYGIINLLHYKFNVKLVSALTDVLYNPRTYPYTTIEEAKRIVLEYINANFCDVI